MTWLQHVIMGHPGWGSPALATPEAVEAGRGCEGDAAQTHVQTVHLRCHRHVCKQSTISRKLGEAVAVLDVFHNVKDLLPLCLPSHSPDIQDGRYMLLPIRQEQNLIHI